MLRVCSSSTGTQLTSLATLKGLLYGTATSTAEDDILDAYITRASDAVEQYLGYPLFRQVYEETVPSGGDNSLMLSRTPVLAIESILDGDDAELDSTGYVIEEPGAGLIRRDEGWPWGAAIGFELEGRPVPGSERRNFTVVYEAGYTFAGSTTTGDWLTVTTGRTLPSWAEQATLETAKSWFKKKAADGSVQSKKIGDLSITYGQSNVNEVLKLLPETALAVLVKHARSI